MSTKRFRVWALLALPLFAVVAVVLALSWGQSGTQVEANTTGPDLSISVAGGGGCDTDGGATKCTFDAGDSFTVVASLNDFKPMTEWAGHQVFLDYTAGLTSLTANIGQTWGDCGIAASADGGVGPATIVGGCVTGIGAPASTATGSVITFDFDCGTADSVDTITMVAGAPVESHILDTGLNGQVDPDGNETLTINCVVPPPTPTPTFAPDLLKDTLLAATTATKVFRDQSVSVAGGADYAQDLDGDTVSGWGTADLALSVSPPGPVIKNIVAGGPLDALCTPDANGVNCVADGADLTSPNTAVGFVFVTADVNCASLIGDFTVTLTSDFTREDGSAVPPEKATSNVATVDFTCNPREIQVQKVPTLSNVFLTAQGAKLAPLNCASSDDVGTLSEVISLPVETTNIKGADQNLAAFEFEVGFDESLVCVNIVPGTAAANMVCIVRDKDEGLALEGIAQIGCVTKKGEAFPNTQQAAGRQLATIEVRPQPELYSQLIANQDNGIPAQILNQECNLADQEGHPIPILSCEDADITFRYLEGDVDADCDVDAADQQLLSFRWGAEFGSLLYNSRYDLEPSGQVKGDGDLDIKDLQFVFGRHNSSCAAPNPAQPPANPKAVPPTPTPTGP